MCQSQNWHEQITAKPNIEPSTLNFKLGTPEASRL
jgi:hypothetical protein